MTFNYTAAFANGDIPDADVLNQKYEDLRTLLNNTKLGDLNTPAANKIIVCNGSGVPQYVTPSGDVTVSTSGVLTIGNSKVTNAKLNLAIQSDTDGIHSAIGTSYIDLATVTPSAGGVYLVFGRIWWSAAGGLLGVSLKYGGADHDEASTQWDQVGGTIYPISTAIISDTNPITLRAKRVSGASVFIDASALTVVRIA